MKYGMPNCHEKIDIREKKYVFLHGKYILLSLLKTKKDVNVYLIDNGNSYDLIDTGIFKGTDEIVTQIEETGFDIKKLRYIIITHCHCDHIGGVSELVNKSGAKVMAHTADIPCILQDSIIQGAYHDMMVQEQIFMKRFECVVKHIDVCLEDGDTIDTLDGLKVINVPGHTPGSIALYQSEQKIMFFGDVIRNKGNKGLVIGVPEKFNVDTSQVIKDAYRILNLPIDYALFGHGEPILMNTKDILNAAQTPEEVLKQKN